MAYAKIYLREKYPLYGIYKMASGNSPWPLGRRCGQLCWFSLYSSYRTWRSEESHFRPDNYQEALKAVEHLMFGSSRLRSPLLYSIPPVNDSAHEEDAIASPFWILEMQKCHNKLLSVCKWLFLRKTFANYG